MGLTVRSTRRSGPQSSKSRRIDIEGACEGSLACSTCHVIVDAEWYDLLKEASEDEDDMLDLAFNLSQTSRLGCQIIITEELDGLTVRLPAATRNLLLG
jgi:2Fe-2S ferredoxin